MTEMTKPHIRAAFEAELRSLKDQILAMGRLVDANVGEAMLALAARDVEQAGRVIEADRAVDQLELAVDEQCIRLLALHQPEASDLRFVASVLKMVTDLERIGDLAVNLAESVRLIAGQPPLPSEQDLPGLAAHAQKMLRDVLDAFVAGDADEAQAIIEADARFDDPIARLFSRVKAEMASAPETVERGVAVLFCAKHIERIADHVTNVAAMVVYLVRGQDVRHARSTQA
jgi:phosphate transport system protein